MSESKNKFATLGSLNELGALSDIAPIGNGPRPDSFAKVDTSEDGITMKEAMALYKKANPTSTGNAILDRILDSLDAITRENGYFKEAVEAAKDGGDAVEFRFMIEARESTHQKSIQLLEKMYDDYKPVDHRNNFLKTVDFRALADNMDSDELPNFVLKLLGLSDDN